MNGTLSDTFDALFALQSALERRLASDWLRDSTASRGPFPPINVFQQRDDFVVVVELPGVRKDDLEVQAKQNVIRISGRKAVSYDQGISVHRRERVAGRFDRTLTLPVQVNADGVKAEYLDGMLAVFVPRAESDKPRAIKIS
jgi:HSP20 family protein